MTQRIIPSKDQIPENLYERVKNKNSPSQLYNVSINIDWGPIDTRQIGGTSNRRTPDPESERGPGRTVVGVRTLSPKG